MNARRSGFSLIELLAVIAIVAVITSLMLVAVQKVRNAADRARAKAEINQITLGLASFKADRGHNPPLYGGGLNDEFRLQTSYLDPAGNPLPWPEVEFLRQSWPQINLGDTGLRDDTGAKILTPELLDGNQTAVLWLCGGKHCKYLGLATSPQQPFLTPNGGESRKRYIELQPERLRNPSGIEDGKYRDPWGTPYAVLASGTKKYADKITCYKVSPYYNLFRGQFNLGGTQVISAGRDKKFATGGEYTPGAGEWAAGAVGADDMSNFRTRELGAPDAD